MRLHRTAKGTANTSPDKGTAQGQGNTINQRLAHAHESNRQSRSHGFLQKFIFTLYINCDSRADLTSTSHSQNRQENRHAKLGNQVRMNRRQCLMNPHHDHRQPHTAQNKAHSCTARTYGARSRRTNRRGDCAPQRLQDKNCRNTRQQESQQRSQEQIKNRRNQLVQALFQPCCQKSHQNHGDNTAPAGNELTPVKHHIRQPRMAD